MGRILNYTPLLTALIRLGGFTSPVAAGKAVEYELRAPAGPDFIPRQGLSVRSPVFGLPVNVPMLSRVLQKRDSYCEVGTSLCIYTNRCCPDPYNSCCTSGTCAIYDSSICCGGGGICNSGEECCEDGCAPGGSQCCNGGGYCPGGQNCVTYLGELGCCPTLNCVGGAGLDTIAYTATTALTSYTTTSYTTTSYTAYTSYAYSSYSTEIIWTYYYFWYIELYISVDISYTYPSWSLTSSLATSSTSVSVEATDSADAQVSFDLLSLSYATVTNQAVTSTSGTYLVAGLSTVPYTPTAGGSGATSSSSLRAATATTTVTGQFSSATSLVSGSNDLVIWIVSGLVLSTTLLMIWL